MSHPIFHDVPSLDMTKPQERQADIDAKIQAFLQSGGEIKAYDTLRRPVEAKEWRSFTINSKPPTPAPAPAKPKRAAPAPVPTPQAPAPAPVVVGKVRVPRALDLDCELKQLLKKAAAVRRGIEQLEQQVTA